MRNLIRAIALASIAFAAAGCGLKGGVPYYDDAFPAGASVAYNATISDSSGNNVGTAQVLSQSGKVIVRLVSLNLPTNAYYLFLEKSTSPTVYYMTPLRGPQGSQNYATGLPTGPVFVRAAIRYTSNSTDPEAASANF